MSERDLTRAEREGSTRFWTKGSDNGWTISAADHDPLMEAWKAGRAFYDGHDVYGDTFSVKLGEVVAICRNTPAAIAESREEREMLKMAGEDL